MNRREFIKLFENGACTIAVGLALIPFPTSSVNAEQPTRTGCLAVSKSEYDSANRKKMLRTKFGKYERTGRLWRRYYWYCHS